MAAITKIDSAGSTVGEHVLPDRLVESSANIGLLYEVVRGELAAHRQGTAKAKSRGEVAGSGAQPWRQNGTGRARIGSTRVPHWTGGGVAFPPVPRSHAFKVNKKARAKAFRMALGSLVEGGGVRVLAGAEFDAPSTRRAALILQQAGLEGPTLVVASPKEVDILLSFRNLADTRVLPVNEVEVQDYVWARSALVTEAALVMLQGEEA
jgi:50S ribosomal protein L4, bacterial/organelle